MMKKTKKKLAKNPAAAVREAPVMEMAPPVAEVPDEAARVRLVDTRPHDCRYIIGAVSPDAMCCGDAVVPGRSYCAEHLRRCSPRLAPPAAAAPAASRVRELA